MTTTDPRPNASSAVSELDLRYIDVHEIFGRGPSTRFS